VFSTKERRPIIPLDLKERLWPYMAGIARMNQFKVLAAGGMPDHAHVLLSLPATIPIAKAVQLIKGGSSKWITTILSDDHLRGRTDMPVSASEFRRLRTRFDISIIRSDIIRE
jgi:putative transposase